MSSDVEVKKKSELTFQLTHRNGEVVTISKPCGYTDGSVDLKKLHESSVSLQTEINSILTTLVEQEKSSGSNTATNGEENGEEEDDEDDDDNEDENNACNGPAEKKQKTA